jgi:hypothetical protein
MCSNFNTRFSASYVVTLSGAYAMTVTLARGGGLSADDGVRLWVNDVQLIDRWDGGANMTAAKLYLSAKTFYRIKLE